MLQSRYAAIGIKRFSVHSSDINGLSCLKYSEWRFILPYWLLPLQWGAFFVIFAPLASFESISWSHQRFSNCHSTINARSMMLSFDSFCSNGSRKWLFISDVISDNYCVCFWATKSFITCLPLSASLNFRLLFLFEDAVLLSFLYAVITFHTVLLANPKKFAIFVTDAPLKRALTIIPFSNSDKFNISTYCRQIDRRIQRGWLLLKDW